MKVVIDISDGTKEQIIALTNLGESFPPKLQERIVRAIINGTSLDNIFDDIKHDIKLYSFHDNYGTPFMYTEGIINIINKYGK